MILQLPFKTENWQVKVPGFLIFVLQVKRVLCVRDSSEKPAEAQCVRLVADWQRIARPP